MRLCKLAIIAALLPLVGFGVRPKALAADISVSYSNNGLALISIFGDLQYGDEKSFINKAVALDSALVIFHSPGGNAFAGVEIGKTIRLKGFNTYVSDNLLCASACAIAWLGGLKRFMSSSARIGFHAVYNQGYDGQRNTSSGGNALLGAYLSQIGLSQNAILYITQASPNSMQWLTLVDARSYGIDVSLLDLDAPRRTYSNDASSYNPPAQTPDWCYKASTSIENLICNDAQLANWENSYSQSYRRASSYNRSRATEIARWNLRERERCGPDRNCLLRAYSVAVSALQAVGN